MQYPQQPQWGPPPKKSGNTGVIIAIAVMAVVCLGFYFLVRPSAADRAQAADYLDAATQQAAAAASAHAKERAELEAEVRKGCKLKPDAELFLPDDEAVRERCRDMMNEARTSKGTSLEFSDDKTPLVSDDGCNRIYASSAVGQNAFGVKVETRFTCSFDPRTGLYGFKTGR